MRSNAAQSASRFCSQPFSDSATALLMSLKPPVRTRLAAASDSALQTTSSRSAQALPCATSPPVLRVQASAITPMQAVPSSPLRSAAFRQSTTILRSAERAVCACACAPGASIHATSPRAQSLAAVAMRNLAETWVMTLLWRHLSVISRKMKRLSVAQGQGPVARTRPDCNRDHRQAE